MRSIFPVQSLVGHSCQPSLQYIEREGGRRIVLQATRAIQAGEPLSVRSVYSELNIKQSWSSFIIHSTPFLRCLTQCVLMIKYYRYTPFLQGRLTLQRWLREQRYVTCACARCGDATELGTFTR